MGVLEFPGAEERAERVRQKFTEDFKQRWKARGDVGEYTGDIWSWEEMLVSDGWDVRLYGAIKPEFTTIVDFDNLLLLNNNPKAYHTQQAMAAILDLLFVTDKPVGRHVFYWEEVHDDAHRNVRDGEEWKDSEYFGTVWYSMELRTRPMEPNEEIPYSNRADRATGELQLD